MSNNKDLNYYQKKKIDEQLKNNRASRDIDEVEKNIREMLVLNGFSVAEIASLLFTLMINILKYPNNIKTLKEAGLTANDLNIETVPELQKLLIKEYINGLNDTDKTKGSKETNSRG